MINDKFARIFGEVFFAYRQNLNNGVITRQKMSPLHRWSEEIFYLVETLIGRFCLSTKSEQWRYNVIEKKENSFHA